MSATTSDTHYKLGIDVGGTFTDLFLWSSDGLVETFKVLSTPKDPSEGVLHGLDTIAKAKKMDTAAFASRVRTIVHGTTVTTNAVLTRKGPRTGLITTPGVRDALEMRRGIREEQYNNRYQNVEPLVPRYLRLTVAGRLDRDGNEIQPLELEDVRRAARIMKQEGVTAVAVCFMNSFANPAHEAAAAEVLKSEMPDAFLSVSSDLLPVIRFYNRVSTTTLNAFSGPVLDRYLSSLTERLGGSGFTGVLLIMQSSGGVALPEVTRARPATTLLSGPAAGPRAGLAFAETTGQSSCLVVDMGGTSFDASLMRDGRVELKSEGEIARLRTALPMLDIVTIGAGGGSIGWLDPGGLLRMGPHSAGADPGPACYARGGELPTCTDANVVLGFLDAEAFAGGALQLDRERAMQSIQRHLAEPLGLDLETTAVGMYRVINSNMAHGVREITVKRGLDPREFPMVVAGGAGGVHACQIASELDIPTIIVPAFASTLCATGMLLTDLAHDYVRSAVCTLDASSLPRILSLADEMAAEGESSLEREGVPKARRSHEVALDVRYLKQYHEVTVRVPRDALVDRVLERISEPFHQEHDRLYGYNLREEGTPLQLINVRVRSVGSVDQPDLPKIALGGADCSAARSGERRAFVPERERFETVPVFDGQRLCAGNEVVGPALIERSDTTFFVTADYTARIDQYGTAVIQRTAGAK